MESKAIIIDSKFINSSDKGISVGENSILLSTKNYFKSNNIGIQAKDKSVAVSVSNVFHNNDLAINTYHKNWRYSNGGSIYIDKGEFQGNRKNLIAKKRSRIVLANNSTGLAEKDQILGKSKNRIVFVDKLQEEVLPGSDFGMFLKTKKNLAYE